MSVLIHLPALEYKAEKIEKTTHAIRVLTNLIETLRLHSSGECPMDEDDTTRLANNGHIISGLANAIEVMGESIDAHIYDLLDSAKRHEAA